MNIRNFLNDESGAITVDWVVLTASIVGIAIAVLILIASGIQSAATGINGNLENTATVAERVALSVAEPDTPSGETSGTGLGGNLSEYDLGEEHDGHQHYYSRDETPERFRVDPDGTMFDNGRNEVATVDAEGNITPI